MFFPYIIPWLRENRIWTFVLDVQSKIMKMERAMRRKKSKVFMVPLWNRYCSRDSTMNLLVYLKKVNKLTSKILLVKYYQNL